jgi:hypothetical protein
MSLCPPWKEPNRSTRKSNQHAIQDNKRSGEKIRMKKKILNSDLHATLLKLGLIG